MKIGKLGLKLSEYFYFQEPEKLPNKMCTLIKNGDFPLKDGDDIDY